ncbi:MAG: FtsW/RodA/SpoVE family cell cycle protein [Lentisphaeria bacterium]|nr:FtsW/RodA/SpoVE family cell cycle protein [Victivallales bacterium]MCR4575359.1 FtsW/RodA/SpoVE family cell cycle protein [Lentisphaeria bacterium]
MIEKMNFYIWLLLIVTITLSCIGLMMIVSTTYSTSGIHYFIHQLAWIGIGIVGGITLYAIPKEKLVKYSHIFVIILAAALTYLFLFRFVSIVFGTSIASKMPFCPFETINGVAKAGIKGGFRWLKFPAGINIQPSEFAKLALLLFLASYYGTREEEEIRTFYKGIIIPMIPTGYVLAAIFLGKDLSQTVITAMMVFAIMFLAGVKTRYLTILCLIAAIAGCCFILGSPMRRARIMGWRSQTEEQKAEMNKGSRYQLSRSEIAIGSGGLLGRGFAKSVMKNDFLPEAHTDFIIAILGEEFGLLGILFVILLYALFMLCLLNISRLCFDRYSMLICQGLGVLIPFQALINIGVVSGFFPTTGLTAPFISYGGSSSISLMMCMGLVFKVANNNLSMMLLAAQKEPVIASKYTPAQ